jgi:hypothetical protein
MRRVMMILVAGLVVGLIGALGAGDPPDTYTIRVRCRHRFDDESSGIWFREVIQVTVKP